MKRKQKRSVPVVRVIVDSRDASKDYSIPQTEAWELLKAGKLDQDLTNSKPGHPVYCLPRVKK